MNCNCLFYYIGLVNKSYGKLLNYLIRVDTTPKMFATNLLLLLWTISEIYQRILPVTYTFIKQIIWKVVFL